MSIFTPEETDEFASIVERALNDLTDTARLWPMFAELGWLSLPLSAELGGMGGSVADVAVVQRAIGRALADVPYLSTAGVALGLVAEFAVGAQRDALVAEILAGTLVVAVDCGVDQAVADARTAGVSGTFDYAAPFAADGCLLVPIGEGTDMRVALIPLAQPGVVSRRYPLVDGTIAARVTLSDAKPRTILEGPGLAEAWRHARARALVLACAEAVGAMDGAFAATLDYAKLRRQFGSTIGSFQVIQHRLVDMEVARRRAASLVQAAADALDADDPDALRLASACKIAVGRSARQLGEQAIQIHGGMGLTVECAAARYHLRILRLGDMFGGADHHLDALGRFDPGRRLELSF